MGKEKDVMGGLMFSFRCVDKVRKKIEQVMESLGSARILGVGSNLIAPSPDDYLKCILPGSRVCFSCQEVALRMRMRNDIDQGREKFWG